MSARVTWEEWRCTWSHPSGGDFGHYYEREKRFDSADEARGFAAGLRTNGRCRSVSVFVNRSADAKGPAK